MKTTIDRAGRLVIPKAIRERAGLKAGADLTIEYREGRIEVEPAPAAFRVEKRGKHWVIASPPGHPEIDLKEIEQQIRKMREERENHALGEWS